MLSGAWMVVSNCSHANGISVNTEAEFSLLKWLPHKCEPPMKTCLGFKEHCLPAHVKPWHFDGRTNVRHDGQLRHKSGIAIWSFAYSLKLNDATKSCVNINCWNTCPRGYECNRFAKLLLSQHKITKWVGDIDFAIPMLFQNCYDDIRVQFEYSCRIIC